MFNVYGKYVNLSLSIRRQSQMCIRKREKAHIQRHIYESLNTCLALNADECVNNGWFDAVANGIMI